MSRKIHIFSHADYRMQVLTAYVSKDYNYIRKEINMNQPSNEFWHLMNKYKLNQTGKFFHWLELLNGTGVQVGDYNYIIHWMEKNMKEIKKEQKSFPEEMPGEIQKRHNRTVLNHFKHNYKPSNHNLYLYYYQEIIGYITYHIMTQKDVQILEKLMQIFIKANGKTPSTISYKVIINRYQNMSVIKGAPKDVRANFLGIRAESDYNYTKTGKPILMTKDNKNESSKKKGFGKNE